MNKKILLGLIFCGVLLIGGFIIRFSNLDNNTNKVDKQEFEAMVIATSEDNLTVRDNNSVIYTFNKKCLECKIGDNIIIEYTGLLDKDKQKQDASIVKYTSHDIEYNDDGIPSNYLDDGIFKDFYIMANNKLNSLSLDEKIGQLLLVRYPDNPSDALNNYNVSGFVFFAKDFKDKTTNNVKEMISNLQDISSIPLLTAVDEEGGSVVRVSSNPNLVSEPFKSPQELYALGGFDKIKEDTINKSNVLSNLGLNLNLAPVVDVSTNPNDYMFNRSLGEDTDKTSFFAKTVIRASKDSSVSYTLKHFPGYGNNSDTHIGESIDNRSYEEIRTNDLPPFRAGIDEGAEAVLVSHNTVTNIDDSSPASLSISIHNLLRNNLSFSGVIITDDLDMGATKNIKDKYVNAIIAGNDLLIVTDYQDAFNSIKNAVDNKIISEEMINNLTFRVLAWKYYKGLMIGK